MKIFLVFVVISTVPIILLSIGFLNIIKQDYIDSEIAKMYRDGNTIARNLLITGYFDDDKNDSYLQAANAMAEGRVVIVNAQGIVEYDSNHIDEGNLYVSDAVIKGLKGESLNVYEEAAYLCKVVVPVRSYTQRKIYGVVYITREFDEVRSLVGKMVSMASISIVGLTILLIAISFYSSFIITRPFSKIIQYIDRRIKGHENQEVIIRGNYEAEQISVAFNKLISEINVAEENRQQFVANVSHELKTPLSSIKILAESLLDQENVPEELYKEFLGDINSEVDREADIINDLLTLVTLDKKDNQLVIEKVNINELVEKILKRLKPLADTREIQLMFESYRNVEAEIDKGKMESVISNIIDNGIKYNKDKGRVSVSLNADYQNFTLKIHDTGCGIPEDSLNKIFKRFYRVDKTRSRATGGTGLGLSIVRETVKKHMGTVKCDSDGESNTTFILNIPLKYIS